MLIYFYIYICLYQCCVQLENFSNTRVCRDYNFQQVKEGNMMSNLPFQPRFFGSFFDDSFQASLHFLSFINPSPQCIDKPKKTPPPEAEIQKTFKQKTSKKNKLNRPAPESVLKVAPSHVLIGLLPVATHVVSAKPPSSDNRCAKEDRLLTSTSSGSKNLKGRKCEIRDKYI